MISSLRPLSTGCRENPVRTLSTRQSTTFSPRNPLPKRYLSLRRRPATETSRLARSNELFKVLQQQQQAASGIYPPQFKHRSNLSRRVW